MKYRTVAPQEDGWSDWIVPTDKELRIVCCDCKLAHDFEFKVVNGEVAFRARRNDSETARLRGAREQAAEICRRYLAGESQRELAAAFGCSQKAIQNTLRCGGVKARSNSEACMLREGKR